VWLSRKFGADIPALTVILTDKYPNSRIPIAARENHKVSLRYLSDSVDANCVPESLHGFRTMFSSFHHFSRAEAIRILQNAVDHGEGIGIFEAAQPRLRRILLSTLMLVGGFATAPFIKPFRLSRLFWTYVVPVIPFVLFFDGVVSCLRAYSREQLSEMVNNVDADGYEWDMGEDAGGLVPITYMLAIPVRKKHAPAFGEKPVDLQTPRVWSSSSDRVHIMVPIALPEN
jgi:hypothetical protein